jgi:hypothetical protein
MLGKYQNKFTTYVIADNYLWNQKIIVVINNYSDNSSNKQLFLSTGRSLITTTTFTAHVSSGANITAHARRELFIETRIVVN